MYYDGSRLLSMRDINGNKPEIFMVCGNNTSGKTTFFARRLIDGFLKNKEKFMYVYRFSYEITDCSDKIFKDVGSLFFRDHTMTAKKKANGVYAELFLDKIACGYVVALNNVDNLKQYSHFFSDTSCMFMDEFQSETAHYAQNEVNKFRALHKAVARGQNKMSRYVPIYMCSNNISLLNPYFAKMGISERLQKNTKFLRGDGFVLEQNFNESASKAQRESAFNRAFGHDEYSSFTEQATYLNDNLTFIEKPQGQNNYLATLRYGKQSFAIREFADLGIVYCDDRPDESFPLKITLAAADHQLNWVMLKKHDIFIETLRFYFEHGAFRFKNLKCKEAIIKSLSY